MLTFKYLLLASGIALFVAAATIIAYDAWLCFHYRRTTALNGEHLRPKPVRWRMTLGLLSLAWAPMLILVSMVVTPLSSAAIRPTPAMVSQGSVHPKKVRTGAPQVAPVRDSHASPRAEGR